MIAAPPGFRLLRHGAVAAILDEAIADGAVAAGLDRPWEKVRPRPAGAGTGRGPCFVAQLEDGTKLFVKQYLRGGAVRLVNHDRYFGRARFLRELAVGRAARAAGLPVGETIGLVLVGARPGWRAWGIARYVEDAEDLARMIANGAEAAPLWRAALALLERCHEAGLEHPDMNLGNLLARRGEGGALELFVVDLDRARWRGAPLDPKKRAKVVARLERSYRKIFGAEPPNDATSPAAGR